MLTHIEIKGYKSLKDVSLDMNSLTVLIGPNGSGKSNFLDVFKLMSEAAHGLLGEGLTHRGEILFKEDEDEVISFCFDFERLSRQRVTRYQVTWDLLLATLTEVIDLRKKPLDSTETVLKRDKKEALLKSVKAELDKKKLEATEELAIFQVKDQVLYPIPYNLLRQLQQWLVYPPIDVSSASPLRLPQTYRKTTYPLPDGSNLFSALKTIQNENPDTWENINEVLKVIYPGFQYLTFPEEGGDGKILLRWWERPFVHTKQSFAANSLSDGTLRLLSLLAILKSPTPPPLICIEEPEVGLHPDWIKLVAELLEDAATHTQVIVATHSPILVSSIQPEHIVVVEKEEGITYLERLSAEKLSGWLEEFQLGDLWLSGHFGGRP